MCSWIPFIGRDMRGSNTQMAKTFEDGTQPARNADAGLPQLDAGIESRHAGSDDQNVGLGGHFGLDAADTDLEWLARRMVQVSFYTDSMGAVVTFNFP